MLYNIYYRKGGHDQFFQHFSQCDLIPSDAC